LKVWIGITDSSWFKQLRALRPEEVNFWQPGGSTVFRALPEEGLFLFKLHHPDNYIVGGGYFVRHSFLPVSLAWKAFGVGNGVKDLAEFKARIERYRRGEAGHDPTIGCIVLAQPFFWDEAEWIAVPESFKKNIVSGKSYEAGSEDGRHLVDLVQRRLSAHAFADGPRPVPDASERYGNPLLVRPRLGQGAFRVLVTEGYQRRCALTGEKTLPVLEAAHIKPYAAEGPHQLQNGMLLRSDLHILFDQGYFTVTPDHHVIISKRIREEFQNGKEYYAMDGKLLRVLPDQERDRPAKEFLEWHNNEVYLG
jgi:putative restriction endonuclease